MSRSAAEAIAPTPGVVASIGRRVGAYVIDMVPFVLIGVATGIITLTISFSAISTEDELSAALAKAAIVQGTAYALMFAWALVLTIMQGGRGSVGQRMCGIGLVTADAGRRIGFWRAVLRNIVFAASCVIVVGYFTPLFDSERRRGWHDRAAGAVMVDNTAFAEAAVPAPRGAAPVANPFLPPPAGAAFDAPPIVSQPAPPASFAPSFAPSGARPGEPAAPGAPIPASAMPVAEHGMISDVPGVSRAAAAPAPVVRPTAAADAVDETRTVLRETRPAAIVALTWDDGTRISVHGRTLFGRNPQDEAGAAVIPVRDETLSLSKTHFVVDGDQGGAYVTDLNSTNGTDLVRAGVREKLAPGVRVALWPGDRLEFGDRTAVVELP